VIYRLCLCLLLSLPSLALAAPGTPVEPIIEMELTEDTVIPGSPTQLTISVLVPTWMLKPPAFPDLEVSHLMVRRPPDSSSPARKRIDGKMWAGVKRTYQLYPMIQGQFDIPARPLRVTYADPETNAPVEVNMMTDPIRLFGSVPKEAQGLDPFVAATGLKLDQTIEGAADVMKVGDAFKRQVVATIEGTSSLFIPPLLPNTEIAGISAYPKEPQTQETPDGGTRTEEVSFVVEQGGDYELPGVEIRWFNLTTKKIETTSLKPLLFSGKVTLAQRLERNWRTIAITLVILALVIGLALRFIPSLRTVIQRNYAAAKTRYLLSARHSYNQAMQAIKQQDLDATLKHVQRWVSRLPPQACPDLTALKAALSGIGEKLYGPGPTNQADWSAVKTALQQAAHESRQLKRQTGSANSLPPLNPTH